MLRITIVVLTAAQSLVAARIYTNDSFHGRSDEAVCSVCHTPAATVLESDPSTMNRKYSLYRGNDVSMEIGSAPQAESAACLSCHDGTTASDGAHSFTGQRDQSSVSSLAGLSAGPMPSAAPGDGHPVSVRYDAMRSSGLHPAAEVIRSGLRLYGEHQDRVECGTCHSPHSNGRPAMLRISNSGSAMCLTCHDR